MLTRASVHSDHSTLVVRVHLAGWVQPASYVGAILSMVCAVVSVVSLGLAALPLLVVCALVGVAFALGVTLGKRSVTVALSAAGLSATGPSTGDRKLELSQVAAFEHHPLRLSGQDGVPHDGNHVGVVMAEGWATLDPLTFGHGVPDARLEQVVEELNLRLARLKEVGG